MIQKCLSNKITRCKENGYLIVDGALGTELERLGYHCPAPLWSAFEIRKRRSVLKNLYGNYLAAGAGVLTSNTYRTTTYSYQKAGIAEAEKVAKEDTFFAVALIQEVLNESSRECLIAGSLAPLEDCLHPALVPDDSVLERFHRKSIVALYEAGVDYIAAESLGSMREIRIVSSLCEELGVALALSVRLLKDNQLYDACIYEFFEFIGTKKFVYAGFNCMPPYQCKAFLESYRLPETIDFLMSPNGSIKHENEPELDKKDNYEELFLDAQQVAQKMGCRVFGGCCGTNAQYISKLRYLLIQD